MLRVALFALLSGCCVPPADGPLPRGTWGGDPDPESLTMRADGTGSLDLACSGGESRDTVEVADGQVLAVFIFDPDTWGADDGVDEPAYEATLEATVCDDQLIGTLSNDDPTWGGSNDLVLVLGRGRGFEVPCEP